MALIKCPKCGCLNAITYSRCSDCNYSFNSLDDTPDTSAQAPTPTPMPIPQEKSLKANNMKLQKASKKINAAGKNIQKIGMGCCGTVVWLFILLIIIGSCSAAVNNKKVSKSSSDSLKTGVESPKQPEEKPAEANAPQTSEYAFLQEKDQSQQKPQEEPAAEDAELYTDPLDDFTKSQKNAILQAQAYLAYAAFSREGLIDQLTSEYGNGYNAEDAIFAIEYLERESLVDWNEQAIKQANDYLEYSAFSRQGLIDQLSSEYGGKFTIEETENAVEYLENTNSVDWYEQAVRQAKSYLDYSAFSEQELINQLSSEYGSQFTVDEAEYGASKAYSNE